MARAVKHRGGGASADVDARHMARCLELAATMRGLTAPNPMVGCVIVDARGRVIAEGVHQGPGQPHAEADAIAKLGRRSAAGGTLYVNLEPCNHTGRTPPCAPAVAALKLARVVVGDLDPIASHSGGAKRLRRAGVRVDVGGMREQCQALNRGFYTWARTGRPHVVLKAGASLDGKIATASGESQWITSAAARHDAMQHRAMSDAIIVGIGTVLADDSKLTARGVAAARNPIRVVLDSHARTPLTAALLPAQARDGVRVIIATSARATTDGAGQRRAARLAAAGAHVLRLPSDQDQRVDLHALLTALTEFGVLTALVEGGGIVHAGFLAADLVDEILLYQAPLIIGGDGAPGWVRGTGAARLAAAPRFEFIAAPSTVGPDLVLRLRRTIDADG